MYEKDPDYLGALTMWDVQVGRLMQLLETTGAAANTAIFYTADNGPHQGEERSDIHWCGARFPTGISLEDAIGSHACLLEALKLLQVCAQWHSSRASTFLTSSDCNLFCLNTARSTNFLRQCKASMWEGGAVLGFLSSGVTLVECYWIPRLLWYDYWLLWYDYRLLWYDYQQTCDPSIHLSLNLFFTRTLPLLSTIVNSGIWHS
jgi:hypothetical protein